MNSRTIFSSINVPGTVRRMRKDRGYTLKELAEITHLFTDPTEADASVAHKIDDFLSKK